MTPAVANFNPTPSLARNGDVAVTVARSVPPVAGALGVPVGEKGAVPRQACVQDRPAPPTVASCRRHTLSNAAAIPWPPPMHMVTSA